MSDALPHAVGPHTKPTRAAPDAAGGRDTRRPGRHLPPSLPCSCPRLGLEPPFSKQPPALSAFGLCSGFMDKASSGGACHGGVRNCPIVWKLIWAQAPSAEPGPGLGAAEARGPLTRSTPGPRGKRPPSSLRRERLAPEPVRRLCGHLVFCLHPRSPRTMTLYTDEVHVQARCSNASFSALKMIKHGSRPGAGFTDPKNSRRNPRRPS